MVDCSRIQGLQVTVSAFCSEFNGVIGINLTHLFEKGLRAENYLLSSCIRCSVNWHNSIFDTEEIRFSETLKYFQDTKRNHIPEDSIVYSYSQENLKY